MLKYHIQTIEVGAGGAASIDFNNIPQEYDDLYIEASARGNRASSNADRILIKFNNSSSSFSVQRLLGTGTSIIADTVTNVAGGSTETLSTAGTFGSNVIRISNYTSSNYKAFSGDSVTENNGSEAYQVLLAGLWSNTEPITSISFYPNGSQTILQYSSFSLYGIKHGTSGDVEAAADGGAITQSGGYTIHTFTSSGTFVANRDMDVEYVVVAGGGGGGTLRGGGGGAGGYRSSVAGESSGGGASAESKVRVSSGQSLLVQVGAGGSGSTSQTVTGTSGTSSSFATITSVGGGGGDSNNVLAALSGGSGGGAVNTGTAGSGTTNQGFAGGVGSGAGSTQASGGGGGAGAAGANASSGNGGAGGAGVTSSITGSAVARAGGGGGGAQDGTGGAGGSGVGGAGTNDQTTAGAGAANTGSGGGGGGWNGQTVGSGGAGGSGIVIIRYPTPA